MGKEQVIEKLKIFVDQFEFKYQAAKHLCVSESKLYNMLNNKACFTPYILRLLGYERVVTITYREIK